ncbi:MAG: hypothetical protein VX341_09260, partial [Bdellovibrionota bacterium]|nr:hypothetical protein [Bdellovibrionota bacterium]
MKTLSFLVIYILLFSCSKAPEGSSTVMANVSFQTAETLYFPHLKLINLETGENFIQEIDPITMATFVPFGAWDIYFLAAKSPITEKAQVLDTPLICGASFGNQLIDEESVVDIEANESQCQSYEFQDFIMSIATGRIDTPDDNPDGTITTPPPPTVSSDFISVWRTTSSAESITLPLRSGYNYNFQVDWGDGSPIDTITAYNDPQITHVYAVAGDYTVRISGLLEAWFFNNSGDKHKIIDVLSFGDVGWVNLENAFDGCVNLATFYGGNTSNVINMKSMFSGATNLSS